MNDSEWFGTGQMMAGFALTYAARLPAPSSPDPGVTNMLNQLLKGQFIMSETLQIVTDKITAMETVGDGMAALLAKLSGMAKDAQQDPAKLATLATDIDAHTAAWTAAVTANTPAAAEAAPTAIVPVASAPEPTATDPATETTTLPAPKDAAPAETDLAV